MCDEEGEPILPIDTQEYNQANFVAAMFQEGGMLKMVGDQTASELKKIG